MKPLRSKRMERTLVAGIQPNRSRTLLAAECKSVVRGDLSSAGAFPSDRIKGGEGVAVAQSRWPAVSAVGVLLWSSVRSPLP